MKKAVADYTVSDIHEMVSAAVQDDLRFAGEKPTTSNPYPAASYVRDLRPPKSGAWQAIVRHANGDLLKVDFSINADGTVTLGDDAPTKMVYKADTAKGFGPWASFADCVAHMTAATSDGGGGYDEDTAKKICGALKAKLEDAKKSLAGLRMPFTRPEIAALCPDCAAQMDAKGVSVLKCNDREIATIWKAANPPVVQAAKPMAPPAPRKREGLMMRKHRPGSIKGV